MDLMFQLPLITLLAIGVLWKGIDLLRAPHDRVLRFLVAALVMLAGGEVLSLPKVNEAIDAATAVGVGKVAFNGVYVSGLCALLLFFNSSARGTGTVFRRQLQINVGLLVGVLIALMISMLATPATMRDHTLGTPHMAEPAIASFYIIGNAYFVYVYLTSAFWARRYARRASRHLGLGLRTMALGLFGLTITSVNRTILVVLRIDKPQSHEDFNSVNWSVANWAMAIVLIGVCYSASVQLITRLRSIVHHRRMHQELAPLWTALTTAYPELVLNRETAGSKWRRLHRLRTHEQRFYRRLIECRDGLVRLSPYLTRVAPDTDLAHGPADRLARHITEALAVKPPAESPHTELSAARIAAPVGNDLNADARELIAISHALHERNS
ncbi:MAB_1171c family putative transporter [Streptomyces sp. N50]|uniref:MAB_1171c family putative transporter n=1 Tax=Streptomyces sp. N50 TaxID=3081765 RepID=UPI0029621F00|nr:MAB_1171c family putative transporter [Streptomyces sp. N50]WOX15479.1 MAB_1171c family putative transporter [Streptomyces sp. N50]